MKKQNALRLVDTRTLDRGQWLEVRRGGIGSSDAATAVGLNPYKSQLELWLEKTGRQPGTEDAPGMDDPRYWGTLLEPYVAVAYQQKTGRRVRKLNAVLQHPTMPFMLANIDREVVGEPDVQILECKTAGEFGSRLWRDGVPEYVQLQVQHQLAVTGKDAADVAVLLCGQDLQVHRIVRDEEVIARLVVLEARFWECVETDTPPAADGSESAGRALRQLYPGNDTSLDSRATWRFAKPSTNWPPCALSSTPAGNGPRRSSRRSSKRWATRPRPTSPTERSPIAGPRTARRSTPSAWPPNAPR